MLGGGTEGPLFLGRANHNGGISASSLARDVEMPPDRGGRREEAIWDFSNQGLNMK